MVDRHHRMNDLVTLTFESAWARLRAGDKLSAVKDGEHLFSFQLRPNGAVKAMIGGAYLAVGRIVGDAHRLSPPPAKWDHQAPMDARERREVCQLFDNDLFQGRLPSAYILVARDQIDQANERAYAAAQPDIYHYIIDKGLVSFLPSIRNSGTLSPAQEKLVRKWMVRDARKGFHVVPPTDKPMSKAEQDRARAQKEMEDGIERNRRRKEREARGEDYEDDYNE